MKHLRTILTLVWRAERHALLRGALLSATVLAMGAALLGLSGWFITAAAAAGLAGMGAVFDVFRPSAMVRFLALGRAAARYGERLLTHDATLRALQSLRGRVLASYLSAPHDRMLRVRSAQVLNRLTADIDALDGLPLRIALPLLAGVAVLAGAGVMLWWLTGPVLALWVVGAYGLGALVIARAAAQPAVPASRRAEAAAQIFRSRLVDLVRARGDLAVYGRLQAQMGNVQAAEGRRLVVRQSLDRIERRAGMAMSMLVTLIVAGALGLGLWLVQTGTLDAPKAALAVFVALAMAEALVPLRRAVADYGRMADAARRIAGSLATPAQAASVQPIGPGALVIDSVALHRPGSGAAVIDGLSLRVDPGQSVAITGPSGVGKSTLLLAVAGLHPVAAGQITLAGVDLSTCTEADLRAAIATLPQRAALMAGSVRDALHLGARADDPALWQVLDAVQLADVVRAKGGLDARIGPRGAGLSGGEGRRLALARAVLRRPHLLLLDEPTEGLDDTTARAVLRGIRAYLPDAAILIAAHRPAETDFVDQVHALPEVVNVAPVFDLDQRNEAGLLRYR